MPNRRTSVSYFRRLVTDLMHFSSKVPSATVERSINLQPLILARSACVARPTWSAIFTKAYAIVAARTKALRQSYMTFPWPYFYEHQTNIAIINVDRYQNGERIVIFAHIPSPEELTLDEIDAIIRSHQNSPLEELASYRDARRLSWFPWPLRRFIWWAGLNVLGSVRCSNFGTFGVTSVAMLGSGIMKVTPLLTSQLHYNLIDKSGAIDMRLSFDHRVFDGATAATALADFEATLLDDVCSEMASMPAHPI